MTFTQIQWAAGLFEGEGCISLSRSGSYRRVTCRLVTTDFDVIQRFSEAVPFGRLYGPHRSNNPRHKEYWSWTTTTFEGAQATIAALWKWLGVRRKRAAILALRAYHAVHTEPRRGFSLAHRCTARELEEMRALRDGGMKQCQIAARFRRSNASVSKLLSGKRKAS